MQHKHLYLTAGLIWGIPGIIITIKGLSAYASTGTEKFPVLIAITIAVLAGFFFMFRKIVKRYIKLIDNQPEPASILNTFPLRGWIIVIFMTCLGIALKIIGVPLDFTASFYSGLGPNLLISAIMFFLQMKQ